MTAHDDAKIAEILGYSAEVCEPDSKPITAYYTSRHLVPVRHRLVEYVESVRADEREQERLRAEWPDPTAQEEPCSHDLSMHDAKIRADERERLRAQVEALESPLHWNDGEDALIYRSQVLALLGGDS